MAVLKLKADPTFSAAVPVPVPGGEKVEVKFNFKHRTRASLDEFMKGAKERSDVDSVMETVTGWELEDDFTRENVELLLQNYHSCARAIAETYYRELMVLRLGN